MGELTTQPSVRRGEVLPPCPLLGNHDVKRFCSGKEPLDDWLQRLARESEGKSARTFVVRTQERVVGYYSLANGSVMLDSLPKKLRYSMPNPVPVMMIGRLAVDQDYCGIGIGKAMVKDAFRRIAMLSDHAGMRAVLVHAIDDEAVGFWLKFDFQPFPLGTKSMFLSISTMKAALGL